MTAINPQTQVNTTEKKSSSWEVSTSLNSYINSASNFSKGALEGLTTFVPLFMGLGFAVEMIFGVNECGFIKILENKSPIPFSELVIVGPICEELIFRGLIQRYTSKHLLNLYVSVKNLYSDEKTVLDKKTEKAARINMTSIAFALMHLFNFEESIREYVLFQTAAAFLLGGYWEK